MKNQDPQSLSLLSKLNKSSVDSYLTRTYWVAEIKLVTKALDKNLYFMFILILTSTP